MIAKKARIWIVSCVSSRHGLGPRSRSPIYASKWCNFEKLQRLEITIFGWQTSFEGLQPEIKVVGIFVRMSG